MNALPRWLRQVPVSDPVDRRNAPFVQVLLMFIGTFVPLNKAWFLYAAWARSVPLPNLPLLHVDLLTDALIVAAAWTAVWMIRRGWFRQAVNLFLGVLLLCLGAGYAVVGLGRIPFDPIPLLTLAIAGLVMGRRTLWTTLSLLASILVACLLFDVFGPRRAPPAALIGKAISMIGIYLLITLLLDRTVAALRSSLAESNQRGMELERANQRLRDEIAERERAREQLIHAQKMEAIGRIASGVAHDFDNVLAVVLGYAARRERIADQGEPALLAALEGVELAARRALAINRKLLSFGRQEPNRPEIFDAGQALRDLQPMLRQLFGTEVRLQLECGETPLPVRLDRDRFELMLLNIAANARDALAGQGTFRVSAHRAATAPRLQLALADDGAGMPETVRLRVFEPFFTTKPSGSGTGLGLAVVRDMVLEAGGDIRIDSAPGQGTTVHIAFPLVAP